MLSDLILKLEQQVDLLLERKKALEGECQALRAERDACLEDKERVRLELDRILAKLDDLEQETL